MSTPQDAMNQPPTDSVLRRHYEQLHAAQNVASASRRPSVQPPPPSAPTAVRTAPRDDGQTTGQRHPGLARSAVRRLVY